MKSDFNKQVEQSEMNQSVDENFNNIHYMNTYMPSMPFISHMHRYMGKQSIHINTASLQLAI
jgi:hypothetical protein